MASSPSSNRKPVDAQAPDAVVGPEPRLLALLDSTPISGALADFLHLTGLVAQGMEAGVADLHTLDTDALEAAVKALAHIGKDIALPLTSDALALRGTTVPALFARLHAALGEGRAIIAPFINLRRDEVVAPQPATPAS